MSLSRKNKQDNQRASSVGVADTETIAQAAVTAAIEVLREEFTKAIETVSQVLQNEFKKILSEAMAGMTERIESLEQRVEVLEAAAQARSALDASGDNNRSDVAVEAIRQEARSSLLIANDNEQYIRRNNLRIQGLKLNHNEDCRQAVANFVNSKLGLTIQAQDIEAAHPLPSSAAAKTGIVPTVIVRFKHREHRDCVIRQRRKLKRTNHTIVEDLTALNVRTLNRVRNAEGVKTFWTWNGKIYALMHDGRKLLVRPLQALDECETVSSWTNHPTCETILLYVVHIILISDLGPIYLRVHNKQLFFP